MSQFEISCILSEECACETGCVPPEVHHVNLAQSLIVALPLRHRRSPGCEN